jgi:hypothetical protein
MLTQPIKAQKFDSCNQKYAKNASNPQTARHTGENYANHLAYFCQFHDVKPVDLQRMSVEELKPLAVNYLFYLKKKECKERHAKASDKKPAL